MCRPYLINILSVSHVRNLPYDYRSLIQGSERRVCFMLSLVPLSAPTRLQALMSVDSAAVSWQKPLSDQGQSSSWRLRLFLLLLLLLKLKRTKLAKEYKTKSKHYVLSM